MSEVVEQIYLNDCDRYETDSGYEYTSGDMMTVEIDGQWITARVEYAKGNYYLVGLHTNLYEGMRVKRDW